ncbi:hypothetical protein BDQ12DRAFT_159965 [Crucibulum laeve]|uniref:DUF6534 domain-containing protein n=1 Tax=Crucibulum laeve TaxID=68775 RepID=A0A5C3LYE8_9AGAR|nr:hypothetical protein BDQ12DRAFT_159965 [Crucibulum laeve]
MIGGVTYKTGKTFTYAESSFKMRVAVGLRDGGSTLCDVLIAGYMWYYLSRRSEGIMKRTEKLVSRIIRLCIVTGTITALVAALELALYFGIMEGYYLMPGTLLGNLYSNSMMVMLNNRMEINGGRNSDEEMGTDANFAFRMQVTSTIQEMVSPSIGANTAPYLQSKNGTC